MYHQYSVEKRQEQRGEEESQKWANELERYLQPYTERLDAYLDRRVVGNLRGLIGSLVQQNGEVTLTTLGSGLYLCLLTFKQEWEDWTERCTTRAGQRRSSKT